MVECFEYEELTEGVCEGVLEERGDDICIGREVGEGSGEGVEGRGVGGKERGKEKKGEGE